MLPQIVRLRKIVLLEGQFLVKLSLKVPISSGQCLKDLKIKDFAAVFLLPAKRKHGKQLATNLQLMEHNQWKSLIHVFKNRHWVEGNKKLLSGIKTFWLIVYFSASVVLWKIIFFIGSYIYCLALIQWKSLKAYLIKVW